MADIASISRNDLETRRKKLRRQRQFKNLQRIWQTTAVSGLAGGLFWVAIQPMWVIRNAEDIIVNGNQLISTQTIQSKLSIDYPQSLWRIEPAKIRQRLVTQPAIASATVNRRLFPPGLVVQVEERIPVAIARQAVGSDNQTQVIGLLDADGVLIPVDNYAPTQNLPNLQVIGNPEQYKEYWSKILPSIRQSIVPISEVNFQDPTNLILTTDLGIVHLGNIDTNFSEALMRLGEMRDIYTKAQVRPEQVEYINLRNPETPMLQMKQKNQSKSQSS